MVLKKISKTKNPAKENKRKPVGIKKTAKKPLSQPVAKKGLLKKHQANPIIEPREENAWESKAVFNPAAIVLNDKIHLLYRALGNDDLSRLGYASLDEDLNVDERSELPAYEHPRKSRTFNLYSFLSGGGGWGGAEDPRIVQVGGEDNLYLTYTACDDRGLSVGLTSIKIDDFNRQKWNWKKPVLISAPYETHKNWVIFPEKINGRYAILHSIHPTIAISYEDNLDFENSRYIKSKFGGEARIGVWDKRMRGAGSPPVKTDEGWLLFYHAMDDDMNKYKVGAMLLDLEDPAKILYRSTEPVLEPTETYENEGFKAGVVYVSGAVVKNGELFVTYGGADKFVCLAHANLDKFLKELKGTGKPKLALVKSIKKNVNG